MSNLQVLSPARPVDQDDEVLDYTQNLRRNIANEITKAKIPVDDPEAMGILLKTLDGMDKVALGKKRIKADENIAGANQALAASVVAGLLQKATAGGMKPFEIDAATAPHRETPMLGDDIPPPVLVDGEVDVAAQQLSYESFQKQFAPEDGSPG